MNKGRVVIVGRTNVGKSTLFNRLSTHVKSMIFDYEGVTRDIVKDVSSWRGREFSLIDTGGITTQKGQDPLSREVRARALEQIDTADVVLFVVDGIAGVTPLDLELSNLLRKRNKRTFLVVNKADAKIVRENLPEFHQLFQERIIPISASHGTGINDLLDAVVDALPVEVEGEAAVEPAYRVTLLGRPNVGKSSLLNQLVEAERALVSDMPGTTREALSERIAFSKEMLQITDTPGIRRQRSVEEGLETMMVKSSFRAMKDAHIVLLVVDATEGAGLVDQELKLAYYAFADMHKSLILIVNKMDLLDAGQSKEFEKNLERHAHLMRKIEKLYISCKTGKNVNRVLPLINRVWERSSQQLPPEELKRVLIDATRLVPLVRNQQKIQIHGVEQVGIAPITIKLRVNYPRFIESSHTNFFENVLRRHYNLVSAPIRFVVV